MKEREGERERAIINLLVNRINWFSGSDQTVRAAFPQSLYSLNSADFLPITEHTLMHTVLGWLSLLTVRIVYHLFPRSQRTPQTFPIYPFYDSFLAVYYVVFFKK